MLLFRSTRYLLYSKGTILFIFLLAQFSHTSADDEATLTSQEPQPEVWLDLLPIDVCVLIARHARGGGPNSHATGSRPLLHLAESNAKQRIDVEVCCLRSFFDFGSI